MKPGSAHAAAELDLRLARSISEHQVPIDLRDETASDAGFLRDLFVACSPLGGVLPPALLRQQADMQDAAYRNAYPVAVRRIVVRGGRPIGRIALDWPAAGTTRCIDVAVLPESQRSGVGGAMLHAWLDAADDARRTAVLSVLRDNPALRLYARLGFRPAPDDDGAHAATELIRPPASRSASLSIG